MNLFTIIFYILSAVLIVSTAMAITRDRLVHAIIYLVVSFFATALLFYLLGAPFLAALEVIIYAGAIMVLFLFMVITVHPEEAVSETQRNPDRSWGLPVMLGAICLVLFLVLIWAGPEHARPLIPATVAPAVFGADLFRRFWFPVEVVSLLLTAALAGALYLGKNPHHRDKTDSRKEAP